MRIDEHAGEINFGQLQFDHLGIIHVVDDEIESSESRIAQSQELLVAHQIGGGDISHIGEHFLGLGISSEQSF